MESSLTLEQEAYLEWLKLHLQRLPAEHLIPAFLDLEAQRLQQINVLTQAICAFGGAVQSTAAQPASAPEDFEEFAQIFGYEPSEDEVWDYLRNLDEMATMDVDLEAVVIEGPIEEQSELEELSRWRQ